MSWLRGLFALGLLALPVSNGLLSPVPPPPPPPQQLQPVLEIIGPVARPECGNALLAMALAPGLVNPYVPFPASASLLFGPLVVVCGSVPGTVGPQRCALDNSTYLVLNKVTGTAAGTPPPVETELVAPAGEEVLIVQDKLPPPVSTAGLGDLAVGILTCAPVASAVPPRTPPSTNASDAPAVDTPDNAFLPSTALGSYLDDVMPAAGDASSAPAAATPPLATPAVRGVAASEGFAYPLVFLLPLVMLSIGGYLGWALTRPVRLPE